MTGVAHGQGHENKLTAPVGFHPAVIHGQMSKWPESTLVDPLCQLAKTQP